MSFCTQCGTKKQKNKCFTCSGSHVHGGSQPYTGHSAVHNHSPQKSGNIVVHQLLSPAHASDNSTPYQLNEAINSTGRPILSGIFEARDNTGDGRAVPFAKITVTYTGTDSLVALFSDRNKTNPLPNPAQADIYGRLPIYYGGGNIDITVEKTCDGQCVVVDRIFNEGGYVDSDFYLGADEVQECLDIETPLFRLYDQGNNNLPAGMISPKQALQWANWKTGLPIGTYSETKAFFECLGIGFTEGTLVFGDLDGRRYRYNAENCTLTSPPDPETVTYANDGSSECWNSLDDFSACSFDEVAYDSNARFVTCFNGANRLMQIPAAKEYIFQDGFAVTEDTDGNCIINLTGSAAGTTCSDVQIVNTNLQGSTFNNAQVGAWSDITATSVVSTGSYAVNASVSGSNLTIYDIGANRLRIETTGTTASGTLTFTFPNDVSEIELSLFDVDAPGETFSSWSTLPDSVTPSFGNGVTSIATFTGVNDTTLTANFTTTGGAAVIQIISVTEASPCFDAQRCVDSSGTVTYNDMTSGAVLTGTFLECT